MTSIPVAFGQMGLKSEISIGKQIDQQNLSFRVLHERRNRQIIALNMRVKVSVAPTPRRSFRLAAIRESRSIFW